MSMLMTCEQIMLLLATPDGTVEGWDRRRTAGVAAGAVADLDELGRVQLVGDGDVVVRRVGEQPVGVRPLDTVLARVGDDGRPLGDLLRDGSLRVEDDLVAHMNGLLVPQRPGYLRLFPTTYDVARPGLRRQLVSQLVSAVRHGEAAPRETVTVAVVDALGLLGAVLPEAVAAVGRWEVRHAVDRLTMHAPQARVVGETLRRAQADVPEVPVSV